MTSRLLALVLAVFPVAGVATTIQLDQSTTLLDASTFTAGTNYIAAFQLTASGIASTQVSLALFDLDGGSGAPQSMSDIVFGIYSVGPNPSLAQGIWQTNGTLSMLVTPSSASSVYTQGFQAGNTFTFTFSLVTDQTPVVPDQFAFQLYDANLSTLLYEVTEDALTVGAVTPEPSSLALSLIGGGALLAAAARRRLRHGA